MYDYYLFPLPRASKWNRPIFDHSEVKIDLYILYGCAAQFVSDPVRPGLNPEDRFSHNAAHILVTIP